MLVPLCTVDIRGLIYLICTYSVGVPRSSLFLCPAVTPWKTVLPTVGYNNPGVRLYKYDRNTTQVKVGRVVGLKT